MARSMDRRDFLIGAAAAATASLLTPARAFGLELAQESDPNFHVYLAFGQSNMEGFPGIQDQDRTGVDPRFRMLAAVDFPDLGRQKGQWYEAVPALCRPGTGLCPADFFGRTLVAGLPETNRVGVVNVSVAGCRIELFDEATREAYAATAAGWMTNIIAQYGGSPYRHLVEMGRIAQQQGVIRGILLHQGESNNNDREWPNKVAKIYGDLLRDLNLNAAQVPLLAGETVNAEQNGATAAVNEIMAELPRVVPTAHVISSRGCEARGDRLHFTPAGYRELGRRYGAKMLDLV
jgi:hypothetical protein